MNICIAMCCKRWRKSRDSCGFRRIKKKLSWVVMILPEGQSLIYLEMMEKQCNETYW